MTGRALRCGSANARLDIMLHWRLQARLTETTPGSGKWRGPCPKDGKAGALHVEAGRNGGVVWNTAGCDHGREAAFPAMQMLVPCAPEPARQRNPELETLKADLMAILTNKTFGAAALRFAGLEALGLSEDQALDKLGITDRSNRRRTIREARKALAPPPAKMVRTDHNRRPETRKQQHGTETGTSGRQPPAKTPLPARMVNPDHAGLSILTTTAGHESGPKMPLTSTFPDLTTRANVVSGPAGTDTDTDTGTAVDLDLALRALETLGAQVIASEPRPSPHPVADAIDTWTASEAGPCVRCGTTTCRYGDRGSALCPDCQSAEVRTAT